MYSKYLKNHSPIERALNDYFLENQEGLLNN